MKTDDKTLIEALRILPKWLQERGNFEGARLLKEAANRLEELTREDTVLVPREPTEEMLRGIDGWIGSWTGSWQSDRKGCYEAYRAMIKAYEEQDK